MDVTPLNIKPSAINEEMYLETYGGIYEHSPWIAQAAWETQTREALDTVGGLHQQMMLAVATASKAAKTKLICAHPDLAGKLAVNNALTPESKSEQAGAGLDKCSAEEFTEFRSLNANYKEKFGFPFIIAVKGHDRQSILSNFRARINNTREIEFNTALQEIDKIALIRLQALTENT